MIATYENIYLTDTSENVLHAVIEQSGGYDIRGTLSLDLYEDTADFVSSVYRLHFDSVSMIVSGNGDDVSVELIEPDGTEWIFERIAGGE